MARDLPTGTVTFLFTDVEGSTRLLEALGAELYAEALEAHRRVVRDRLALHGGVEVDTQGDAFFCAFPSARSAVTCAGEIRDALASGPIRVRMGVHTGEPLVVDDHYVGMDVHRAARIGACGHGGQVVVSTTTAAQLEPGTFPLRDLGLHRLKDLGAPVTLFQLGDGDFPPLKALFGTNLPVPATPFLGRESDLAELLERAAEPGIRLLTLTGPGGTGKTRLGLQLAAELSGDFPGGVWWLPLAPLREDDLVASTLANALGVQEEPGRTTSAAIAGFLAEKRVLLLLDNCEHLLDGVAELVSTLLASCPRVVVLATSREPLAVAGEHVCPVDPLVPADAVSLFAARARAAGARLDLEAEGAVIAALCERLDNLPLAIELAAARVAALPPATLLERLGASLDLLKGSRDADERQRTLRATIAWSHDLLEEGERRLFRRLSAFAGGGSLDAVEAVCEADLEDLSSLVAKSLVRQGAGHVGEPRYWMLETIREFAAEELERSGDGDVTRGRLLGWCAELARGARGRLEGRGADEWFAKLELERENLRGSLRLALRDAGAGSAEARADAIPLALTLSDLHGLRGRDAEREEVLRAALALSPAPLDEAALRARLGGVLRRSRAGEALAELLAAERALDAEDARDANWWPTWVEVKLVQAHYFYFQAELEPLAGVIAELEPVIERYGTPVQNLEFLHVLAQDAFRRERYVLSQATEDRVRDLYRRSGELEDKPADFVMGFCLLWRRKPEEALSFFDRGLASARRRGNAVIEVRCLLYGAVAERWRGEVESVRARVLELEALDDLLGYRGLTLANACWVAYRDGDHERARVLGEDAIADWGHDLAGRGVFQWSARFPLLGVELAQGHEDLALEHARAMLDPSQQPLPEELRAAVELAVEHGEGAALVSALEVARRWGYT